MATTAKGIRYPVGSDAVAVHTHLQNMASDADALIGLTPLTTKGDLIVHNGSIETRLPVGSNGKILVANSSATEGVEWVDPATGTQYIETIAKTFAANDSSTSFLFSSIPNTYETLYLDGVMSVAAAAGTNGKLTVLINGTAVHFYQYTSQTTDWTASQLYEGTVITANSGGGTIDSDISFADTLVAQTVFEISVFDAKSTTKMKLLHGKISPENSSHSCFFIGTYPSTSAVTSIEIKDSTSLPMWGTSHARLSGARSA